MCLRHRAAALVLTASAAVLAAPSPAWACEPGYCIGNSVPTDGDVGVTPEARIAVFYNTTPGTVVEATLIATDAPEVEIPIDVEDHSAGTDLNEISLRVAFITPQTALSPKTEYQVTFSGSDACAAEPVVFETGAGGPSPPAPAEVTAVAAAAECDEPPEELNDCIDGNFYPRAAVRVDGVVVDGAVAYAAYLDDALVAIGETLPVVLLSPLDVSEPLCLKLVAIGVDGAASPASESACVDLSALECTRVDDSDDDPNSTADAGPSAGDSDAGEDLGRASGKKAGGCSAAGQDGSGASLLLLLLAGAAHRRRRPTN